MGKSYSHGAPHTKGTPVDDHVHGHTDPHPAAAGGVMAKQMGAKSTGKEKIGKSSKTSKE